MRIAFSGAHRTGKSTLLEQVSEVLTTYQTVDEPYFLLEEEGYEVAEEPSIDDFEAQLEASLQSFQDSGDNVLFDRCPADILAYLATHEDADSFDDDAWVDAVAEAMNTLDLVVFVPVEHADRIPLPRHEDRELRLAVHEKLDDLLLGGERNWDVEVLRVEGDVKRRLEQVLERVKGPQRD